LINILSLQDLKRTGFNKLKQMFHNEPDIIIQERGKDACVLVDIDHYNYLRECELEVALIRARQEIAKKKYTTGAENHIQQLESASE
jgi:PHD/YefM family antitoxin component YafN of YafNO toxin-antitoxin module